MIASEYGRGGAMKVRIAVWAMVGFLVAAGWAVYALATFPRPITPAQPLVWNLALLTQPIAFASFHFNFPASIYLVFASNAVTYALLGLIVESLRRQLSHAR
jgi:hypothetical protein